jgi:PAS domain S-box-containing protein
MLGYDPETFHETNAAWLERLHPEDHDRVARTYRDYIAGAIPQFRVEFRQRMAGGEWTWILSQGKVVERDAEGRPLRMLGTHTDISAQKRLELALRASESLNRSIVEHAQDLIFINREDRVRYVNPAGLRLLGARAESDLVGRSIYDLFDPGSHPLVRERIARLRAAPGTSVPPVVEKLRALDGRPVDVEVQAVSYADGPHVDIQVICRDIGERLRQEAALRASQAVNQAIVSASPLPILSLDLEGRVQSWNPAAERAFGWSAQEATGRINPTVPADKLDEFAALRRVVAAGGQLIGKEALRVTKSGSPVLVSIHAAPLRDDSGKVTGIVATVEDITERKRAEQALRDSNEELRRFNRAMVGRELAMVELKRQVNALTGELGREAPYDLNFLDQSGTDTQH